MILLKVWGYTERFDVLSLLPFPLLFHPFLLYIFFVLLTLLLQIMASFNPVFFHRFTYPLIIMSSVFLPLSPTLSFSLPPFFCLSTSLHFSCLPSSLPTGYFLDTHTQDNLEIGVRIINIIDKNYHIFHSNT